MVPVEHFSRTSGQVPDNSDVQPSHVSAQGRYIFYVLFLKVLRETPVNHVKAVNSKVNRLKTWNRDFNGVSTKYLQNYPNWFVTLEKLRDKALPLKKFSLPATTSAILLLDLKIAFLNHSDI
jgi:hypothetical protein